MGSIVIILILAGSQAALTLAGEDLDLRLLITAIWVGSILLKILLGDMLRLRYLTLPSTFFYGYLILMAVPSLIVFMGMAHPVRADYLLAVTSVLVTVPLGVILATLGYPQPSVQIRSYAQTTMQLDQADARFLRIVILLLICGFASFFAFLATCETVPLLKVVRNLNVDDVELRFETARGPLLVQYAFAMTAQGFIPISLLYFYVLRMRGRLRTAFWALLPFALIVAAMGLERGPALSLFVLLLLANAVARGREAFTLKSLFLGLAILIVGLCVAGFISAYQYHDTASGKDLLDHFHHVLINRLFLGSAYTAAKTFSAYPEVSSHLGGKYIRLFSIISGGRYLESYDYVFDPSLRYSILPASFVADLYRNWGWPAVVAGGVVLGFAMQCIQLRLFHYKNAVAVVVQAMLILSFLRYIPGNAFGIVTTSILLFVTLVAFVWCGRRPRGPSATGSLMNSSCERAIGPLRGAK